LEDGSPSRDLPIRFSAHCSKPLFQIIERLLPARASPQADFADRSAHRSSRVSLPAGGGLEGSIAK
jgi:hypothetical protein